MNSATLCHSLNLLDSYVPFPISKYTCQQKQGLGNADPGLLHSPGREDEPLPEAPLGLSRIGSPCPSHPRPAQAAMAVPTAARQHRARFRAGAALQRRRAPGRLSCGGQLLGTASSSAASAPPAPPPPPGAAHTPGGEFARNFPPRRCPPGAGSRGPLSPGAPHAAAPPARPAAARARPGAASPARPGPQCRRTRLCLLTTASSLRASDCPCWRRSPLWPSARQSGISDTSFCRRPPCPCLVPAAATDRVSPAAACNHQIFISRHLPSLRRASSPPPPAALPLSLPPRLTLSSSCRTPSITAPS